MKKQLFKIFLEDESYKVICTIVSKQNSLWDSGVVFWQPHNKNEKIMIEISIFFI